MSRLINREGGGRPLLRQRVAVAILVGVFLGLIFVVLNPYPFTYSSAPTIKKTATKVTTTKCRQSSPEYLNHLRSLISAAREDSSQLKQQIWDLRFQLRQAKQWQDDRHIREGSSSSRTNPTVTPDESANPELAQLLKNILGNHHRELIVVLANSNAYVKDSLLLWLENVHRLGIGNYLIYALDDEMLNYCLNMNVPVYKRRDNDSLGSDFDTIAQTGTNHDVSGLKFRILRDFLQLGYSVLLSDIDIVYVQNPFEYLHRDADVEAMTDGHSKPAAYGYDDVFDDPSMGWSRFAHTMRIWVYNSGFFYIRPTVAAIELLDRVASRLAREKVWDQQAFNEELFTPSHPGYEGLHISKRTMDYHLFMNSKVLFKTVRKNSNVKKILPVVVHMNYHLDKVERMRGVMEYYVYGKANALDSFPDANPMPKRP